jgi:hypothetical protein
MSRNARTVRQVRIGTPEACDTFWDRIRSPTLARSFLPAATMMTAMDFGPNGGNTQDLKPSYIFVV